MRNQIIAVALLTALAPAFAQNANVDCEQLVWRGTGTDTLSDKPEKNTAKMNKAIAKMFEQYPPTQK